MTAKTQPGSRVSAKTEHAGTPAAKKSARPNAAEPLGTPPPKTSQRPKAHPVTPPPRQSPPTGSQHPSPARHGGAVAHEPASAPKATAQGRKVSTKHGGATEPVQQPHLAQPPSPATYQQIGEEYDQAIRGYADYYLQQQGVYGAGYDGQPSYGGYYAGNAAEQWYGETPWSLQGGATREESIYLLEQAARDFHQALPYIRSLKPDDKTPYLASWREYLTAMAGLGAELIDALEKELASVSSQQ